jgi:hypothetical protein
VLGILVLMTGAVVVGSLFAPPETVKAMINGHIVSRGVVVFLIIPTIAILCIQDRISGEAAVAALSSIAGYILGGITPAG